MGVQGDRRGFRDNRRKLIGSKRVQGERRGFRREIRGLWGFKGVWGINGVQ